MSYTKGKWDISASKIGIVIRDEKRHARFILLQSSMWMNSDNSDAKEKEDNAKLISAAPELLEALEELTNKYDEDARYNENLYGSEIEENLKKARAAIAKAKG